jgi:hypothetical protein
MTPHELERRLLPMVIEEKIVSIKRNVFKPKPAKFVIYLPDRSRQSIDPPQVTLALKTNRRAAANIVQEVLDKRDLAYGDLVSEARYAPLVDARREVCWRIADETGLSVYSIARIIKRDHTTVIYSIVRWCADHNLPLPRGKSWKNRNERYASGHSRKPLQRQHHPEMA